MEGKTKSKSVQSVVQSVPVLAMKRTFPRAQQKSIIKKYQNKARFSRNADSLVRCHVQISWGLFFFLSPVAVTSFKNLPMFGLFSLFSQSRNVNSSTETGDIIDDINL